MEYQYDYHDPDIPFQVRFFRNATRTEEAQTPQFVNHCRPSQSLRSCFNVRRRVRETLPDRSTKPRTAPRVVCLRCAVKFLAARTNVLIVFVTQLELVRSSHDWLAHCRVSSKFKHFGSSSTTTITFQRVSRGYHIAWKTTAT